MARRDHVVAGLAGFFDRLAVTFASLRLARPISG